MCDTLVATPEVTANGKMLFAKNSDREPNEAQALVLVPAADHPRGSNLRCTYIEIPQAAHTHAVLLSQPCWMWGAEMGANEHGVVIGNEAVFSKIPPNQKPALLGMDLLRLGLERGSSAQEALGVITQLLETHGQGGNCGLTHPFYYHNSFLIADAHEAWVLETVDRLWAAKKVVGVASISNGYTLGREWDLASPGLVETAVQKGWARGREDFDLARCYADALYTPLSDSRRRQSCTVGALQAESGRLTAASMMAILRSHASGGPDRGLLGADVCMHAGFGPVRNSQTVASWVAELGDPPVHWVTGSAAPCTGIFTPVWMDAGLPDYGPAPSAKADDHSHFWRHEALHRSVLMGYEERLGCYQAQRDALEADFLRRAAAVGADSEARRMLSAACLREAQTAREGWLRAVQQQPAARRPSWLYRRAWAGFNRQAGWKEKK